MAQKPASQQAIPPAPQPQQHKGNGAAPTTQVSVAVGSSTPMGNVPGLTAENYTQFPREQIIQGFGNVSNAIRGLAALGLKPGPISRHLDIRYQHARNVLSRPLKRQIAEERAKAQSAQPQSQQQSQPQPQQSSGK